MLSDMEAGGETLSVAPAVERPTRRSSGLGVALRRARDPLLFGVLPLLYAVSALLTAHDVIGLVGFDFRGTVWEPARALLDGAPLYPEPTRAAIELGNPAVYPPLIAFLAAPLALLSVGAASVAWAVVLGGALALSLWIVQVRDWRCYTIALASAPALDGFFLGNLTILILVPVALAWRYRERAAIAGLALGVAVAAKLFVWPLVVWLLVTRRFRAAAWATASAVTLVLGSWALIGFEGLADYPELLRQLQDVYATRSLSVATAAGGLGASVSVAVAVGLALGIALLGVAAWLARGRDGHQRAFALAVVACVVATPIVWLHYWALLFVPIAIRWPRLSAAWFFGFVVVLAKYLPGIQYQVPEPCCRPTDVPKFIWDVNHGVAEPWQALGVTWSAVQLLSARWDSAKRPRLDSSRC